MSDINAAPAEAATIDPAIVAEPNPIEVDNVDHEAEAEAAKVKAEPKAKDEPKKPSTREALEAARAKMDKAEADEKAKPEDKTALKTAKPGEEKTAKERDETGKFKGKEPTDDAAKPAGEAEKLNAEPKEPSKAGQSSHDDPPARFSPEAKAAWKEAPEHVRAETHRAMRELETGIEEHRKRWEPVKQYDDMAKQYGTTLPAALERYVAFDRDLNEDLYGGLDRIVRDKTEGQYGLKDIIAEMTGQKPEESQQRADQTIHRLEQMVDQLSKQVKGLGGHVQETVLKDIDAKVSAFAADKPWFDALQNEIAAHIKAGMSLEDATEKAHNEAQEKAKALGFIPQEVAEKVVPPAPDVTAQTGDKGTKSITGAPGAGSEPAVKKPSTDIRASIRKATSAVLG